MKKHFVIFLVAFLSLHKINAQTVNTSFSTMKTEVCVPGNLLDMFEPLTMVQFVLVNSYDSRSGESWKMLRERIKLMTREFHNNSNQKLGDLRIVFLTGNPRGGLRSLYCDKNSNPIFPSEDQFGKGIYMGTFEYQRNQKCGRYDGLGNNAFNTVSVTDDQGGYSNAMIVCMY